ncbi:MAG: hypothetical protein HUJ26_00150 [Planctomycetaceae bacterium]|nr:hypothetical protein [Planctomycetaceae bacterium]
MGTITTSFAFNLTNGDHVEQISVTQFTDEQTGVGAHKPIVEVGTTEEVVSFGDVTTAKWLFVRNLDATNFIEIGPESGGAMVVLAKLEPGEWGFVPISSTVTLRAKADTAACKMLMLVTEA